MPDLDSSGARQAGRTSEAVRELIRTSDASISALAREYGLNRRTVTKWRNRQSIEDQPPGPKARGPWALRMADEVIIRMFRRFTALPLDDCLYALRPAIPNLTRSTLQRSLVRGGLNRLDPYYVPPNCAERHAPGAFFVYAIPITTDEGTIYFFTGFDQISKIVYSYPYGTDCHNTAVDFVHKLVDNIPYAVEEVITNNQSVFAGGRSISPFTRACQDLSIAHKVIDQREMWHCPPEQWGMRGASDLPRYSNRHHTIDREAKSTLSWVVAYTFDVRLKALDGRTPFDNLTRLWDLRPGSFRWNPTRMKDRIEHMPC